MALAKSLAQTKKRLAIKPTFSIVSILKKINPKFQLPDQNLQYGHLRE